jgi:DNA-binding transcriptional MerR regulator
MSEEILMIGEVAALTGVAVSALRYYEEIGLMPRVTRVSGQRRYPLSAVKAVGVILLLQEVGFTLREAKILVSSRPPSLSRSRDLARQKIADIDERIVKAKAARSALEHSLRCRHTSLLDCPEFSAAVEARLAGTPIETHHPH